MQLRDPPDNAPAVVRTILSTTHDRHVDLAALIDGLDDGGLTWAPAPEAPALAGLVLHILDVEGHLAAIASGEDDAWTGENGSHILDGATFEELREAIDDVDRRVWTAFASLDEARLNTSIPDGPPLVDALLEDLDHCAIHHGQAQLTRNLWEAAHPEALKTYEHWR
jgi:DinB superfamily